MSYERVTSQRKQPRSQRLAQLTAKARKDPKGFQRELRGLMRLGSMYVWAVVLLLVAAIVGAIVAIPLGGTIASVFILWIAGGAVFFVLRSMREWAPAPRVGVLLKRSESPQLFALIDDARKYARLRRVDRVHLTQQLELRTVTERSFGIVGAKRVHLIIGLPLMALLGDDEFQQLLRGRLSAFAGAGAGGGQVVGGLPDRDVWQNIATVMAAGDAYGGVLFRPVFRALLPKIADHTTVFERERVLDACRSVATAAERNRLAAMHTRLALAPMQLSTSLEERLTPQLVDSPTPTRGVTRMMCDIVAERPTDGERLLETALAKATGWHDGHPSLREILTALLRQPDDARVPERPQTTAADAYLDAPEVLMMRIDDQALDRLSAWWLPHHLALSRMSEELRIIEHDARFGDITAEQRLRRAVLMARLRPEKAEFARAELEELVDTESTTDPEALYALGKLRVRAGEASGVELLERAGTLRPEVRAEARREVGGFHAGQGRTTEARKAFDASDDAAAVERDLEIIAPVVNDLTSLVPHALEGEALDSVVQTLRAEDVVAEAWLARKQLPPEFAAHPVFVLIVRDALEGRVLFPGKARRAYVQRLVAKFPGRVVIAPLDEPVYGLWRRMRGLDGAHVFLRSGEEPYA